jgi:hypothetical protein
MFRTPALACLALALLATVSCGEKPDVYNITIPSLKATADESIIFVEVVVNAGTIQSVSNIPIGWQVRIDNDANWISKIRANAMVGAATLSPDELKRIVFNVRRNETDTFKFNVTGTASLSKTFDKRKLDMTMGDFTLAPTA